MRKSVKEKIIAIVYGTVHGVVLLQTVLAIIWAVWQFTTVQAFDESRVYLSMAEGMYADGFRLIGYPLLLRLCMWLGTVFKAPFSVFLYLLQLIIVNYLTDRGMSAFLRGVVGRKVSSRHAGVLTALVVTNPFVWQMIFAALPDALCFGLTFYLLGNMFLWMKKKEESTTAFAIVSLVALLLLSVLQRKAFWVALTSMAILVMIGWIRSAKQYAKDKTKPRASRFVIPIVGALICLASAVFVNEAIRENTIKGETMHYSLSADAMKRFVYPNLYDAYPNYTEEFKEQMPDYIIQTMNGGGIEYYYNSMGIMMEIRWGGRKTTQLCRMLNFRTVLSHKQTWIKSTAKEWFAGVFSPFVLSKRTYPFGDSVNPLYLNLMWKKAPSLTLLYVNVGRWGFPVCIMLLLLCGLICLPGSGKERIKHSLKHSIFFIGLIMQTALSTILLSVPLFDFRNCLLPCMLWAVWGMSMIIFEKDEELFFIGKEAKWEKQH